MLIANGTTWRLLTLKDSSSVRHWYQNIVMLDREISESGIGLFDDKYYFVVTQNKLTVGRRIVGFYQSSAQFQQTDFACTRQFIKTGHCKDLQSIETTVKQMEIDKNELAKDCSIKLMPYWFLVMHFVGDNSEIKYRFDYKTHFFIE